MLLYDKVSDKITRYIIKLMLVTHKLSGLVAHDLSGSHRTPRRGAYETDRVATGDSTNEIRGSLFGLDGEPFNPVKCPRSLATWLVRFSSFHVVQNTPSLA